MELPRDHVNAFVVELENSVVVVDTLLALSSTQELRRQAESFNKPIEAVLMTHGHPDHYSGLKVFDDVPRLGSQGCFDLRKVRIKLKPRQLRDIWEMTGPIPELFQIKLSPMEIHLHLAE